MANTLLTHTWITNELMVMLSNYMVAGKHTYKGFAHLFGEAVEGYTRGTSVTVAKPNKFRTVAGPDITNSIADITEPSVTVTVDVQRSVPMRFTQSELSLSMTEFRKRHIIPSVVAMSDYIDVQVLSEYPNVYNWFGTAGTSPSTLQPWADADERFTNEAVPSEGRVAVISPRALNTMTTGELKGLFHREIVDDIVRRGLRGQVESFELYRSANVQTLTTGTRTNGTVKTTSAQNATTLALQGLGAAGTILAGERFTVSISTTRCFGVNPVNGTVWENNQLRQFVVTANATADGAGDATVNVSPKIISSAAATNLLPHQTVNGLPTAGDTVTFYGSASTAYKQNMLWHPDGIALTVVPIAEIGPGVEQTTVASKELGLSLTLSIGGDILVHRKTIRLDALFGVDTPYGEFTGILTS